MSRSQQCRPFPLRPLIGISILVVGGITLASRNRSVDFSLYFGELPPPVAATSACIFGLVALLVVQKHFGFCVVRSRPNWWGWIIAVAAAVPFMVSVTLADLFLRFPADINVPLPIAAVFYPTIGFVAQMMLHVTPFVVVLSVLTRLFPASNNSHRVWLSTLFAALPEAVFQIGWSRAPGGGLSMLDAFVATHLFGFGLVELVLFRRFDYVSMYLFRLTYYGYWHILWGSIRIL